MTNVKIAQIPGALNEYALEDGTSVGSALETAGLSPDGFTVSVNGSPVTDMSTTLTDGDRVTLTKAAKGN